MGVSCQPLGGRDLVGVARECADRQGEIVGHSPHFDVKVRSLKAGGNEVSRRVIGSVADWQGTEDLGDHTTRTRSILMTVTYSTMDLTWLLGLTQILMQLSSEAQDIKVVGEEGLQATFRIFVR